MSDPLRPSHRKRCYGHLPLSCASRKGGGGAVLWEAPMDKRQFLAAAAALAGVLVSMTEEISPFMGFPLTVTAFVVVILGGLGNVLGSLIGGRVLGLVPNTILLPLLAVILMLSAFKVRRHK